MRHDKFAELVDLGKIKSSFEFHVESVGMYKPEDLVVEALRKLKHKAIFWLEVLQQQQDSQ